ncbi:MAG TPA: hypothetical protein VG013_17960 [Gemmataceae bacterium]|jgi:hypothetical protein|nr:hypothetical protein [Gemmataceae bacterium]
MLAGLGFRAYDLAARSLWFDEAFTWRLTQFPFPEMMRRITLDNSPPLYYVLLKVWLGLFGTSAGALRSFSVLCGGLTIAGMYLFAAEAFGGPTGEGGPHGVQRRGWGVGVLVAGLIAVSVFQIRWSWETRMYSFGTALAALSSWALFRALHDRSASLRPWLVYGLITLGFAYGHNYALFTIAAQVLFVLGFLLVRCCWSWRMMVQDKLFWHALTAADVLVVGWLPWLPFFVRMRAQVQGTFWTHPLRAWDLVEACYEMMVAPENARLAHDQALVVAGLCGLCLLALLWRAGAAEWYVFLAAVVPIGLSVLVSLWDTKVFGVRYLVFAHLFLLTCMGVLVRRIPLKLERGLVSGLLLAGFLYVHVAFWRDLDIADKPGARAAISWIHQRRQPGEPLIVASPLLYLPVLYHASEQGAAPVYLAEGPVPHYFGTAVLSGEEFMTAEQLAAVQCRRAWVVNMTGWGGSMVAVPPDWVVRGEARFPEVYRVQGEIIVVEYQTGSRRAAAGAGERGPRKPWAGPSSTSR